VRAEPPARWRSRPSGEPAPDGCIEVSSLGARDADLHAATAVTRSTQRWHLGARDPSSCLGRSNVGCAVVGGGCSRSSETSTPAGLGSKPTGARTPGVARADLRSPQTGLASGHQQQLGARPWPARADHEAVREESAPKWEARQSKTFRWKSRDLNPRPLHCEGRSDGFWRRLMNHNARSSAGTGPGRTQAIDPVRAIFAR
jgi:hypothetical protein